MVCFVDLQNTLKWSTAAVSDVHFEEAFLTSSVSLKIQKASPPLNFLFLWFQLP